MVMSNDYLGCSSCNLFVTNVNLKSVFNVGIDSIMYTVIWFGLHRTSLCFRSWHSNLNPTYSLGSPSQGDKRKGGSSPDLTAPNVDSDNPNSRMCVGTLCCAGCRF